MYGIWFATKRLQAYLLSKRSDFSKHMRTEQKIVTELTIKFLNGLGPEFKKAIKAYIQEKCTHELNQAEDFSDEMLGILTQEEKMNDHVTEINSFYSKIVKNIVHFEWCLECREAILSQKLKLNKQISRGSKEEKEDTIFGEEATPN